MFLNILIDVILIVLNLIQPVMLSKMFYSRFAKFQKYILLPVRKIPHLELPVRRTFRMIAAGSRETMRTGYKAQLDTTNIVHLVIKIHDMFYFKLNVLTAM